MAVGLLYGQGMSPSRRVLRVALFPAAFGLVMADAILVGPAQARACSIATVYEHEIDTGDPDAVAPGAVSLVSVEVAELGGTGGCGSQDSCEGTGTVSIVVRAEDDATPAGSMGFTIELVSGSLPPGLNLPDGPVRGWDRGDGNVDLLLVWSPDGSDSMEFVVRVSAVDAAGNVGDSTDIPVIVEDEGGCAAGGLPASGAAWLLAVLAALFVLRARRSPSA